ncbi:MAG: LacI family DNA-binding transcriptional regulator [Lachnospiraceae bacterium]|nr:LacI family DNA-binding transcriptional regulator [Lachnospiraceae bacterium]
MAVTIRDVAALAGVSPSTVSRTCKDHSSISRETKEKVRFAMAQLGYEPNISANSQTGQSPQTISIILPPSSREVYENSFYLEAIRGISQFCNGREYISTIVTGQDEEEILRAIQTLGKDEQMGGYIILYSKQDDAIIDYLYNEGLLYVLIGKAKQFVNQTIYIDNDNLLAGKEATEYLYSLGHRRIAYVGSEYNMLFSAERKAGYQLALSEHQIPIFPDYCIEVEQLSLDQNPLFHALLKREDRPTAVVASDDILAVALKRICVQCGLSVPEDLSIVSFNNSLFARITSPQLTSIDINSHQLGIEAASQLINHIENPNLLATKIIVPHSLIIRGSCRQIEVEETL